MPAAVDPVVGVGKTGDATERDAERSAVYAVEDQWGHALDRGGELDFFGSMVHLPCQRVFTDIPSMQAYVDALHPMRPVRVRHRAGSTRAHYEPADPEPGGRQACIAIPSTSAWACREVILLHEVAHHLRCHDVPSSLHHDARFRGHLVTVAAVALGEEAAFILRAGYQAAGLQVHFDEGCLDGC